MYVYLYRLGTVHVTTPHVIHERLFIMRDTTFTYLGLVFD